MPFLHLPPTAALTKSLHARLAETVARRRQSQAAARRHRAVLHLDDHLLRDIGLDPRQVGDRGRCGRPI